ncbi:hypothetical protein EV426DRAFT_664929 [Tirmania nivea]|nr:hypothetical protein EV426DRAFT_664929 [Tirmania nivea]
MDSRKARVPVTEHPQHNSTPPPVQPMDDCTNTTTAEIIAPPVHLTKNTIPTQASQARIQTSELSERERKATKFYLQRLIRDSITKESTRIEKWLHHIQGLAELSSTCFRDLDTEKGFQDWIVPEPLTKMEAATQIPRSPLAVFSTGLAAD